jgi:hypothetical protein
MNLSRPGLADPRRERIQNFAHDFAVVLARSPDNVLFTSAAPSSVSPLLARSLSATLLVASRTA